MFHSPPRNHVPTLPMLGVHLETRYVKRATSARKIAIDGGLLLLNETTNCLFAYNDTAKYIWDLIESHPTERRLAHKVAQQWNIPTSRALPDIQAIVNEWRQRGLLAGDTTMCSPSNSSSVADTSRYRPENPEWAVKWTCQFGEKVLEFLCDHEPIEPLRTLLRHQEQSPGHVAHASIAIKRTPHARFTVECNGSPRICTADPAYCTVLYGR
jgi:hypothetical protein